MKNDTIEIMAPVGSWESLSAALQAGATSVYFGIEYLNMRARSSANFTTADLHITGISWDHTPSNVAVRVTATNAADSSDTKSVDLDASWQGTISGLSIGQTYSITATVTGGNAARASVDGAGVTIAQAGNNVALQGHYTTTANLNVSVSLDHAPSGVTFTATAVSGSDTKSATWTPSDANSSAVISGLQIGETYTVTLSASGANAGLRLLPLRSPLPLARAGTVFNLMASLRLCLSQ